MNFTLPIMQKALNDNSYISKWVRLGRCINLRRYSCVLTGIIGTLPVGYIDVTDTIATVTVNIVVE